MIRKIDPTRVVDRVGIDPTARNRVLDSGPLCKAEVSTFGNHSRPDLASIYPDPSIRQVANLIIRFDR